MEIQGPNYYNTVPEYYPDLDDGPDRRFINWFTTYEDSPCISPLRIFCATLMTIVNGCRG